MKTIIILTMAMAAATIAVSSGQEAKIDLEARKRSIPIIEQRLKGRYAQIAVIGNDIFQLHKRVDENLAQIADRLAAVRDSAKSGQSVGNMKMEIITGLQSAIEAFQSRRFAMGRELQEGKSGIPSGVTKNEIGHFDMHTEMHIEQMLKLSKSFTQEEDVKKYESARGSRLFVPGTGWYPDPIEISDEWRQNRRDRALNKKQHDEVTGALQKSIERCELGIRGLRHDLENKALSGIDRDVIQSELDDHLTLLQKRQGQLEELAVVAKPETTEISRDAVKELEEATGDLMDDVKSDLRMIFLKHAQLNREQSIAFKLKDNLEARGKWLEEYEKKGGE